VPILSEKGVKFTELGCLALITLPLSAKFFLAPILDTVRAFRPTEFPKVFFLANSTIRRNSAREKPSLFRLNI